MRYLSVCSGIEAATVAWHPLGFDAFAYSEIEKFPCELLKHHYPQTPNFGDMTKFKDWPDAAINILVGGTPCQSFSVAGLRKGLDDPRGNLMLTYLAIANKYRPKWLVWENVPGVLSSNGGLDFASLLRGLEELGYGFAYRVLDAQYFGVPQRRRRVFVIGCIGNWQCAAAVLFEQHSLQGNIAPRRKKGQDITEFAGTLAANGGGLNRPAGNANELDFCVVAKCLTARGNTNLDSETMNMLPTYALAENIIGRKPENGGNGDGFSEELSYTLNATGVHGVAHAQSFSPQATASQGIGLDDISATLDKSKVQGVFHKMAVRRLMPIECERLQGFPNNYTLIPWDKLSSVDCLIFSKDSPRYKALGNSMAVPVMRWIGKRIKMVDKIV